MRKEQRPVHGAGEAGKGRGQEQRAGGIEAISLSTFAQHVCLDEGVMPSAVRL